MPLLLFCVSMLSCTREAVPPGPIAGWGSTPIIDGVFDSGEWDDAVIVRADTVEQFRIKHDGVNLYVAVKAGGGELRFDTDAGLRILHWSAQLGSAAYIKTETSIQTLDRPFAYELWALQNESPSVIRETLERYLAENGWVSNLAGMGNLMESELAISFEWLGIHDGSQRFVELPGLRVQGGLMLSRDDPRMDELLAMSLEERMRLYPSVFWPAESATHDSMGTGLRDTIWVDPVDFRSFWIDLRR
ncbi:hypothetical protein ACFL6T_06160 [Candidatus Zixiibacteriota bacterium]